jgi:hypothetical protein
VIPFKLSDPNHSNIPGLQNARVLRGERNGRTYAIRSRISHRIDSDAVVPLILDEQGNGHYEWKEGHFETHRLIDHTWSGMWVQEENDRKGGFTVEFSPDFSEGGMRTNTMSHCP